MRQKILTYTIISLLMGSAIGGLAIATPQPIAPRHAKGHMRMRQVDQHFIEMMIPHHQDAVAMAELALTRAKRPEVKALAKTIKKDQNREIQQMRTWYQQWYGKAVPANPTMDGGMMGGRMHRGRMGNMMEDMMAMDIEALKTASDFDREFIRQMIPHHQMAVMMAGMLQRRTTRPEMQKLANDILRSQAAEINQMQQWYQTWYPG